MVKGWTTTKKLGIKFDKVVLIFIGDCGSIDHHYSTTAIVGFGFLGRAHTHVCDKDPLYQVICVSSKDLLLNSDGTPSQLLIHELAHVITPWEKMKCLGNNDHVVEKGFENGHGEKWKKIMKAWDQIPSLDCSLPY